MAEKCVIGIDVGTTGVKVLALSEKGSIIQSAIAAYPLYTPQAGWTEQDPADWWSATIQALQKVLPACRHARIAGIGLSGQMHGMVALDNHMQVVRRAILWNDQRTEKQCRELTELAGGEAALLAMTNNQMLTGYTAGKIRWLQQNEPENYSRTHLILNPKDYIRYCLTGTVCTDVSDASGTGLYDVRNNKWHTGLMSACRIDTALLPQVLESTDVSGNIHADAAEKTGLPQVIPVSAGGGDAVISTTGLGLIQPGRIGITLGTSGVVAMGTPSFMANPEGKLQVFRGNIPGRFTAMGVTLAAAGSYHWFRQALGRYEVDQAEKRGISAFHLLDEAASAVPAGSDGLVFLPYLTGERCPIHDSEARGAFIGLTSLHHNGHFARSVLEGVAYSLRQVHELITISQERWLDSRVLVLAGGGAVSPLWRQIIADVFQLPVQTVYGSDEGGAFGAALVAGVTSDLWPDLQTAVQLVRPESETWPNPDNQSVYDMLYSKYKKLYPALRFTFT